MRGIDTAYNYGGFASHQQLARIASDLLGQLTLSTKVGFFPVGNEIGKAVHSLQPGRLYEAVERSADQLGRPPDLMFLHNPERSLSGLSERAGGDCMVAACAVLADAVAKGLCAQWGISSWDPRLVVRAVDAVTGDVKPDVLLLRAGLTVPKPILDASEELSQRVRIPPGHRWGMSPFGGNTRDAVWSTVNLDSFLAKGQHATTTQAAFRLAYEVPSVARLAVGTSNSDHLAELVAATNLAVRETAVGRYRQLIS